MEYVRQCPENTKQLNSRFRLIAPLNRAGQGNFANTGAENMNGIWGGGYTTANFAIKGRIKGVYLCAPMNSVQFAWPASMDAAS